jgi:putative oxygen-independent coproporphyrinogen III oxidase
VSSHRQKLYAQEDSSLYIHIPFCRHRCGYCAFAVSTKGQDDREVHRNYLRALEQELVRRKVKHGNHIKYRTLYIGGGTPSRLHPEECKALFEMISRHFNRNDWEEVTYEINPEDLEVFPSYPQVLQSLGVTRISLGTQTTSSAGLKILERQTDPQQVKNSVVRIRDHFHGSLSLDLIIGWPGQTLEMLEGDDFPFLRLMNPDHLSIYILNIEPGTKLERDRRKGKIKILDEDLSASLWEALLKYMQQQGYQHYEISNFCKPGHHSLHNTLTWRGHCYLGLGVGAVSRMGKTRWTNVATPELYVRKLDSNRWPVASAEAVLGNIVWQEALLLSLRHREGLRLDQLSACFAEPLPKRFWESVALAETQGEVKIVDQVLYFTSRGWSRFDAWISDWMLILEGWNEA